MTRRRCLALGAGAGAALLAGGGHAAEPIDVVVELFSSQGCNSCPPADKLLGELRGRLGVLALTFHVDYWDYLGWKDTLAGPDFSQRQYDYAKARGDMDVFTPQMIVNGSAQVIGSDRAAIEGAIKTTGKAEGVMSVPVTMTSYSPELARVRLAKVSDAVPVPVMPEPSGVAMSASTHRPEQSNPPLSRPSTLPPSPLRVSMMGARLATATPALPLAAHSAWATCQPAPNACCTRSGTSSSGARRP